MENNTTIKSKTRIIGEIITLINNIFVTIGTIIGIIMFYSNLHLYSQVIDNFIGLNPNFDYIYNQLMIFFMNNKFLIVSTCIVIVALIWTIRALILISDSNMTIAMGIILGFGSLLALIGYSLILYDNIRTKNEKPKEHIDKES